MELTVGLEPTTACLQGRREQSTGMHHASSERLSCRSASRLSTVPLLSALLSALPPTRAAKKDLELPACQAS